MSKNKSIDGLAIRDPIKPTAPSTKVKVKKTLAPHSVIPSAVAKSVSLRSPKQTIPKTDPKTVSKTTPNKQTIEDFLKPVHAFDFDSDTGELTATKSHSNHEAPRHSYKIQKKKKSQRVRRTISIIALVIVLALIALISWAVFWGNDIIAKITGGQGNVLDLIKFIEPTYDPLKTDSNGRTNILAFGTSGYNMEGDEGNGIHAGAQLTDSIMMISLNQETGDIAMLSLPRDLKASPTCTATGKINEVYWCNNMNGDNETAGATALMEEVGGILGIEFQYYAHLNWGSLISIVDILNGIDVTLDEGIYDYYWTGAVYEPGVKYTLDGEAALGLARARHGTSGGDFSRGASQQKILVGIKNKILEKELSITDIIGLASTLGDNFRSNFSINELKSVAHLTFDFDFESMRQIALWPDYMTTGTLDNGISYVFPRGGVNNYSAIQTFVAENLSNDPRTYEHPSIAILNATGKTGIATAEKTKLEEAGYVISVADNAPEDVELKQPYTIYSNKTKPGTKDMLEKLYNIKVTPLSDAPESISRDYDFIIVLGGEKEQTTEQ